MGVVSDILRTYRAPRAVVRHRIGASDNEGAALITLVLACGLIFVAQWPRLARVAFETGQDLQMLIGATMLAWVFIMPLVLYVFSGALGFVMRALGYATTGFEVRIATFWPLLAASPLWLLFGLTAGFMGPGAAQSAVGLVALGAFIYFWGMGLIEVAVRNEA